MKRKFLNKVSEINSSIENFIKDYDYIQKFKENTFVSQFSDSQIKFTWEWFFFLYSSKLLKNGIIKCLAMNK